MDAERGPRSAVSWLAYLLGEAIAAVTVHALDMTTILLGAASIAPLEGHGRVLEEANGNGVTPLPTIGGAARQTVRQLTAAAAGASGAASTRGTYGEWKCDISCFSNPNIVGGSRSSKFFGGACGCAGCILGVV
jgi:hypothetical protein